MQLRRYVGLVDLGIATVIFVAVALPNREMYAEPAMKGTDAEQFGLALAEARTIARPDDGMAVESLTRKLGEAGFKDWAIDTSVAAAERAKESPTRWRALLAASVAHVDHLDAVAGLDYANRAIAACDSAGAQCPSFEQVRMQLYQAHLDAGVKSGIDPRKDPKGFRKAGESSLRQIRLKTGERAGDSGASHAGASAGSSTGSAAK